MQKKEGEGGGGDGRCLTFFKGIINSLSALVTIYGIHMVKY